MRGRSQAKTNARLKARQAAASMPKGAPQGAFTMPGSRNPHKSYSLATRTRQNKKGR